MKSELPGKFSTFTHRLFKFIKNVALKQSPPFFLVSFPLGGFFNCRTFQGSIEPTAIATSLLPHTLEGGEPWMGWWGPGVLGKLSPSSGTSTVRFSPNHPGPRGLSLVLWDLTYVSDSFHN